MEKLTDREKKDLIELSGRPVETAKVLRIIDDLVGALQALNEVVQRLEKERDKAEAQLSKIDSILVAVDGLELAGSRMTQIREVLRGK